MPTTQGIAEVRPDLEKPKLLVKFDSKQLNPVQNAVFSHQAGFKNFLFMTGTAMPCLHDKSIKGRESCNAYFELIQTIHHKRLQK